MVTGVLKYAEGSPPTQPHDLTTHHNRTTHCYTKTESPPSKSYNSKNNKNVISAFSHVTFTYSNNTPTTTSTNTYASPFPFPTIFPKELWSYRVLSHKNLERQLHALPSKGSAFSYIFIVYIL